MSNRAYLELKLARIINWINNPVVSDARKEALSEQFFEIQDQLKLAA